MTTPGVSSSERLEALLAKDTALLQKVQGLAFARPEDKDAYAEALIPEIERLQSEALEERGRRLEMEDAILTLSPAQRRNRVLDYIRRGSIKNPDLHIMPEAVLAAPSLLDSGLIDFAGEGYDETRVIASLLKAFNEIESEVTGQDRAIKDLLQSRRVTAESKTYLNQRWYGELLGDLSAYVQKANGPIHPNNPLANNSAEFKNDLKNKLIRKLESRNGFSGATADFIDAYEQSPETFSGLDLGAVDHSEDPIKRFVYERAKDRFLNLPKIADYQGEVIEDVPSLKDQRRLSGIRFIDRGVIPDDIKGGVILDGNFGFDENGQPIVPDDKLIIDHHDAMEQERYDTATTMARRFWKINGKPLSVRNMADKVMSEEMRPYMDIHDAESSIAGKDNQPESFTRSQVRLTTMINHLDSDSILAIWAFRNPNKAKKYSGLIADITACGDFLTGSGELDYGATARDYNYIIETYLKACIDRIKEERTADPERELEQKRAELAHVSDELAELDAKAEALKTSDPDILALAVALDELKRNKDVLPQDKGKLIGQKNRELQEKLSEKMGDDAALKQELAGQRKGLEQQITATEKSITSKKEAKVSQEENERVLNHLLGVVEDIILNPFKYKKFLEKARQAEIETVESVGRDYRSGKIEIVNDSEDPEILRITPLKSEHVPRYPSIDGQYFFFRSRVDFNQPIIVTEDKDSYLAAINTQDKRVLSLYDFNVLIDRLRPREDKAIQAAIDEKEAQLFAENDPKKRKGFQKDLDSLRAFLSRNKQKQLWRNRNQMVFCFKSFIPREEFLGMVSQWKQEQEAA